MGIPPAGVVIIWLGFVAEKFLGYDFFAGAAACFGLGLLGQTAESAGTPRAHWLRRPLLRYAILHAPSCA